jgi:hypothetical protein
MISRSQLSKGDAERAGWYFYEVLPSSTWSAREHGSIRHVVNSQTSVARDVVSFITDIRTEWMLGSEKTIIDVPSTLRLDGGASVQVKLALNPASRPRYPEIAAVVQENGILDLRNFQTGQLETALLRVSLYFVECYMAENPGSGTINWVENYWKAAYPAPDLSSLDDSIQGYSRDGEIAPMPQPTMTSLLRLSTWTHPTAELAVERLVGSALAGIFHVRGCKVLS